MAAAAESKTAKYEPILVPLDPNGGAESMFLCVNGRNLLVRRGEQVEVPAAFAEVYRNAQRQQKAAVQAQRAAMSND